MKIGFLVRSNLHKWGGDIGILYRLKSGLESLGHEALLATSPHELLDADHLFLTNTCFDLRSEAELLSAIGKPYSVVPFHEDFLRYQPLASGFFSLIASHLKDIPSLPSLGHLALHPEIVSYYGMAPKPFALYNKEVLASARVCIANSQREAAIIKRDSPSAHTAVVKWSIPYAIPSHADDSFLKWTGLSTGSYLLQIGRMQPRKNQLASIVATRDLDIPLVLIAIESFESGYETACIEAAAKWRKAPTIIISQKLSHEQKGPVRIIPMPEGKKLPESLLWSAYNHAGLYIHPAFQELPGAIFLEAAAFGLPMIGSSFCTIDEYLQAEHLLLPLPHDLSAIRHGVTQLFGKRFPPLHPRPALEMTRDFIAAICKED